MAKETEIVRACRLAGGQSELARKLTAAGAKVTPQAVYKWVKAGKTPPDKASIIEQLFPGKIISRKLCPSFPWPIVRHEKAA